MATRLRLVALRLPSKFPSKIQVSGADQKVHVENGGEVANTEDKSYLVCTLRA